MSEADSILFGRAELERAFTALGERLVRRGVVADIFIVGGAWHFRPPSAGSTAACHPGSRGAQER